MVCTIDIFAMGTPKAENCCGKGPGSAPRAIFLHKSAGRNKTNDIDRKQCADGHKKHPRIQRILDIGPIDAREHIDR